MCSCPGLPANVCLLSNFCGWPSVELCTKMYENLMNTESHSMLLIFTISSNPLDDMGMMGAYEMDTA